MATGYFVVALEETLNRLGEKRIALMRFQANPLNFAVTLPPKVPSILR